MRHRKVGIRTMATVWATVALGLVLTLAPSTQGQGPPEFDNRWHVDENAPVGGDGVTWLTAFTDLQAALFEASQTAGTDEIWVAVGTYYPDDSTSDRSATFHLQDNVSIFGGFLGGVGGETEILQRDPETNTTVLSGQLQVCGDPGAGPCDEPAPAGIAGCEDVDCCFTVCDLAFLSDCCDVEWDELCVSFAAILCDPPPAGPPVQGVYHVVTANLVDDSARLDGFTITGGRADGGGTDDNGAGILIVDASPVIARCTFEENHADVGGGGIEVTGTAAPTVIDCSFFSNIAGAGGGGMRLEGGTAEPIMLVNCVFAFQHKTVSAFGAAIFANGPDADVINCTFYFNDVHCGNLDPCDCVTAVINIANQSHVTITNSIIWEPVHSPMVSVVGSGSSVTINDSNIQNGEAQGVCCFDDEGSPTPCDGIVTWGVGNIGEDLVLHDPMFVDVDNRDFRLGQLCSLCIDRADTNAVPPDSSDVDNDGDTDEPTPDRDIMNRIVDGLQATGGEPDVDMGAYEFVPPSCPWDCGATPDDAIGIVDFLELLTQWGQKCTSCDFGVGAPGVGINEMLELLMRWSTVCPLSSASPPPTLQEELDDACLDKEDDWDEYVAVMADPASSQFQKNRYDCWMRHYIIDCSKCSCPGGQGGHLLCPGQDPFN